MSVLPIVTTPDPVLRRKARKLREVTHDTQDLIDNMIETMRAAPGVGLAAPQVGVSARVVVIEYGDEEDDEAPKKLYALVNPEIVNRSVETVTATEGCLSIPRMMGDVERHEKIQVKGLNRMGKPVKLKLEGWLARIFQHEIDHLDGILYTDRAEKVWIMREEEEMVDNV